jgi:hypothetical protein
MRIAAGFWHAIKLMFKARALDAATHLRAGSLQLERDF